MPERPIQSVPFPRFTYAEVMERFGSDKPDLRFGMELVDLAPALAGRVRLQGVRRGACRPAAASRRSWRPGMGGATRREIDELTELARRFGAKGLVHLAVSRRRRALADREVPGRRRGGPPSSATTGASDGDLVLVVADRGEVDADVLGRLRAELGGRLGLADPTVLSYLWVHRFPMYQWDAEGGRWDATHNPFSGVVPEDEALLTTTSGDLAKPLARTIPPGGPARCSTTSC